MTGRSWGAAAVAVAMAGLVLACRCSARAGPRFEFGVDPRLELAGIVELLSEGARPGEPEHSNGFVRPAIPYVDEAERFFARYRAHPAVRAASGFKAFDFGQRSQGLIRLSPLPELRQPPGEDPGFFVGVQGLRDFARDTDFIRFFEAQSPLLGPDVARLEAKVEAVDYLGRLERYSGLAFAGRYRFYVTPFISRSVGANAVTRLADGTVEVISVFGLEDCVPAGDGPPSPDFLPARIWHEAGHGVLDDISELYGEDIANKKPARWRAGRDGSSWIHFIREHMVRAVMVRLVRLEKGEALAAAVLEKQEAGGMYYLRPLVKRLEEYERSRDRFPTLADFYPRLLEALPAEATEPALASPLPYPELWREWAIDTARPFERHAQRLRAIRHLDAMLSRSNHPGLRLKRAILSYLVGRPPAALRDAEAVLEARPSDQGALIVKGLVAAGP